WLKGLRSLRTQPRGQGYSEGLQSGVVDVVGLTACHRLFRGDDDVSRWRLPEVTLRQIDQLTVAVAHVLNRACPAPDAIPLRQHGRDRLRGCSAHVWRSTRSVTVRSTTPKKQHHSPSSTAGRDRRPNTRPSCGAFTSPTTSPYRS